MILQDKSFLRKWNNYTPSKTLEAPADLGAFANRVDAFLRTSTTSTIDKMANLQLYSHEASAPQVSQKAQNALDRSLNAKINDASESKMKKIFAAVLTAAGELAGSSDGKEPEPTSEEIAAGADTSFTALKVEAQVGKGALTCQEASNVMVETQTARLGAKLGKTIEVLINGIGDVANTWIASQCLPAIVIAGPIIRKATKTIGPKVGEWVKKGVERMAEYAERASGDAFGMASV